MIAHPAPHCGRPTSEEAARRIEPHLGRLASMVLNAILAEGGATCDRVEEVTGLSHQTASARCRQLFQAGRIYDSGRAARTRSGRNAIVWQAIPQQTELFR